MRSQVAVLRVLILRLESRTGLGSMKFSPGSQCRLESTGLRWRVWGTSGSVVGICAFAFVGIRRMGQRYKSLSNGILI